MDFSSLVRRLSDDLAADLDLTLGRRGGEARVPATLARLHGRLAEVNAAELPLLIPLLTLNVGVELRSAVLRRFEDLDPERAAECLISCARGDAPAPAHLAGGLEAFCFAIERLRSHERGFARLREALHRRGAWPDVKLRLATNRDRRALQRQLELLSVSVVPAHAQPSQRVAGTKPRKNADEPASRAASRILP